MTEKSNEIEIEMLVGFQKGNLWGGHVFIWVFVHRYLDSHFWFMSVKGSLSYTDFADHWIITIGRIKNVHIKRHCLRFHSHCIWAEALRLVLHLEVTLDVLVFCSCSKKLPHTYCHLKEQIYYFCPVRRKRNLESLNEL